MTIVACWLDKSYGVRSLTALADARASSEVDGIWYTHSDNTVKLFATDVRCYRADSLSAGLGSWVEPYHETTIGIGFAGHCFEALTVIAHIQRAMGAIASIKSIELEPDPVGLVNLAVVIADRYMKEHNYGAERSLELLLFGWHGPERPWIAKLIWNRRVRRTTSSITWPTESDLVTIGDGAASTPFRTLPRLRRQIARRFRKMGILPATEAHAFSKAILDIEASKRIEEGIGKLVESEFIHSVGGIRQKLQVAWDGKRSIAAHTADDVPALMDGLPSVRSDALLSPIPIVAKMG